MFEQEFLGLHSLTLQPVARLSVHNDAQENWRKCSDAHDHLIKCRAMACECQKQSDAEEGFRRKNCSGIRTADIIVRTLTHRDLQVFRCFTFEQQAASLGKFH